MENVMLNLSSVNKHTVSKLFGLFKVLYWFQKYSAFSINTQSVVLSRNEGYSMTVCTDVLNKSCKLDLTQTEMDADGSDTQENKCIRVSLRNQCLTGSQLAASLKSTCQAAVLPFVLSFKEKATSGTGE